jgi:hypothetical protein
MCDLNHIELTWAKIKRLVHEDVTKDEWQGYCKCVENIQKECWEGDTIVPNNIDCIILHLNPDSDGDNDSDRESSDTKDWGALSSSEDVPRPSTITVM